MNDRFRLDVHLEADFAGRALRQDVQRALTTTPKSLPPKWFYDKVGSDLFEAITELPEYYPTRAEAEILTTHAADIADASKATMLVELGSGSSTKTRLLLDALQEKTKLRHYVALDVSASALTSAGNSLLADYPDLHVHGLVADFDHHLDLIPAHDQRLIAFLGGTIGNFEPGDRQRFLREVRNQMTRRDFFLLGTDLVKSPDVLVPAYDDSQGVTAAFNRNVLAVINRELDADFPVADFEHIAVWDSENEWIEMRLKAPRALQVQVRAIELEATFDAGEQMRTEISAKFRHVGLNDEMRQAGFHEA
ncbi:MAG TPA: L-histidine N(alpha)-methyltransferase, partial [Actinomycetes bacterium]|nr:L-histidine N(alpha)-methyltransferase [Actinomycetes bacterium]